MDYCFVCYSAPIHRSKTVKIPQILWHFFCTEQLPCAMCNPKNRNPMPSSHDNKAEPYYGCVRNTIDSDCCANIFTPILLKRLFECRLLYPHTHIRTHTCISGAHVLHFFRMEFAVLDKFCVFIFEGKCRLFSFIIQSCNY